MAWDELEVSVDFWNFYLIGESVNFVTLLL